MGCLVLLFLCAFLLSGCGYDDYVSYEAELFIESQANGERRMLRENLIEEVREDTQHRLGEYINQQTEAFLERQEFLLSLDNPDNSSYFEDEDVHVFFPPWSQDVELMLSSLISEEHLEALLSHEQRRNHAEIITKKMSEQIGYLITPDEVGDYLSRWMFSWTNFVGEQRFEIALDYLGVGSNMLFDEIIHLYIFTATPMGRLRDIRLSLTREEQLGIPSEFDPYDPQRIIVEMLLGFNEFASSGRPFPTFP